jgi:hypothetical protein
VEPGRGCRRLLGSGRIRRASESVVESEFEFEFEFEGGERAW